MDGDASEDHRRLNPMITRSPATETGDRQQSLKKERSVAIPSHDTALTAAR